MLKKYALAFLLSCLAGQVATAEELTAAKVGDIKQLMEITGSVNIGKQFASASSQQMFQILKASRPEIPDRALVVMNRELMNLFEEKMVEPGGMLDQSIPIYAKYFTHQEILDLLAFYQTPVGQKSIQVLPKVVNESMIVGQRWGESLVPEIERRIVAALRQEGLLPKE